MNAVMAIPSIAAYNASKGGVNNLTRQGGLFLPAFLQVSHSAASLSVHCAACAFCTVGLLYDANYL